MKGILKSMNSIKAYIEKNLTEERRLHISGVVKEAICLSKRYDVDPVKAETAGFFHDIYRGVAIEVLNKYVREMQLGDLYIDNENLAHGKVAAFIMERDYNIKDPDIINAVAYHTTGRAGMSKLEKIIYLADMIEPGRNYPEVKKIRELARQSLDQACLYAMEHTVAYLKKRGKEIHPDTLEGIEAFKKKGKFE